MLMNYASWFKSLMVFMFFIFLAIFHWDTDLFISLIVKIRSDLNLISHMHVLQIKTPWYFPRPFQCIQKIWLMRFLDLGIFCEEMHSFELRAKSTTAPFNLSEAFMRGWMIQASSEIFLTILWTRWKILWAQCKILWTRWEILWTRWKILWTQW